jgi:hypothetical protein
MVNPGMKRWVPGQPALLEPTFSLALKFCNFFLTTLKGNAIIIRVQGRLAQLVRALR